jgi:hypothetical protein
MANNEPLVFDVRDFRGKQIIFTKKKLEEKKADHPELRLVEFIRAVQGALKEPEEVWPDAFEKEKHCYYGKYQEGTYAKVVVYMSYNRYVPSRVVSAFEIDKIKERKYQDKGLKKIV